MFQFDSYLWCVLGILISVLLPVVWETVYRYFPKSPPSAAALAVAPAMIEVLRITMPYFLLGLASLLTAILIVAALGDTLKDYRAALLAGYAWDSTLQKLRR